VDYITIKLPFSVDGGVAGELPLTAWWFKIAAHRVSSLAKQQQQVLPGTPVGWRGMFRSVAYEIAPNRRYADDAVTYVYSQKPLNEKLPWSHIRISGADEQLLRELLMKYAREVGVKIYA
jgi:hypothetical protein